MPLGLTAAPPLTLGFTLPSAVSTQLLPREYGDSPLLLGHLHICGNIALLLSFVLGLLACLPPLLFRKRLPLSSQHRVSGTQEPDKCVLTE